MAIGIEKLNWEKIKSFFWNAIVGAILISMVGFNWWGWVLESTAQLEALKGKTSWNRGDYLKNQGWATMPGEEEPDHGVAEKCAELLIQSSY